MIATSHSRPTQQAERAETINLHRAATALVRNRWLALGMFLGVLGLAVLATWLATPVYEAEATLKIDDDDSGAMLLKQLSPIAGMDRGRIETDMVVLRSRSLAELVVDSLGLQVAVSEPAGPRSRVFRQVTGSDAQARGTVTLERQRDGSYTLLPDEEARGMASWPRRLVPGRVNRLGGLSVTLAPSAPERVELEVSSMRGAVRGMRTQLGVTRPNRDAKVVHIRYRSTDPLLVAAVPNALTESFVRYTSAGEKSESRSAVDFLRDQVSNYEGQLRGAESQLRGFREQARIVDPKTEATEQVRRLATIRAEREELQAERDGLASVLRRIDGNEPGQARQLAAFPTFLSNKAVQDVLSALNGLESERLALLSRRTEQNVDVRAITERVDHLEAQLLELGRGYLQSLNVQLAAADANLARFGVQMEAIPAREVEFARLLRQQELLAELYTLLQTRLKESEIQLAVEPAKIRVVDAAISADRPISPSPVLNLLLGCVLGGLAAATAVFLRETLSTRIRPDSDILAITQGIPVLATIPRIRRATGAPAAATTGNGHGKLNGRVVPVDAGTLVDDRLVVRRDPRSPVAEAYRALRTNVTFSGAGSAPATVVVTSAMPGDGKTTTASNLAITLSLQGKRVLLVDADLRRGRLHQVFGLRQDPGLSHVLHLGASLEDTVQSVVVAESGETLDVLSSGVFPPNPAELLSSDAMSALLGRLRERYDMVVLDAPPLNLVTDAALLGTQMDATLVVARVGVTDRRALQHALGQLAHLRVRVAGLVLNDAAQSGAGYYGYGYSRR